MVSFEAPPVVAIESPSIEGAWCKAIDFVFRHGARHTPDYKVNTVRAHVTVKIDDPHRNQHHWACPMRDKALDLYKKEITPEYAEYYESLPEDSPLRFDYCYAKQLFMQEQKITNLSTSELLTLALNKALGKKMKVPTFDNVAANIRNLRVGSRRHVGALWENDKHIDKHEDQPCWNLYKLELINDTDVILYGLYRSWDLFGGFPANLPAITYGMQKVMDDLDTGYKLSSLYFTGWDTHIYETDWGAVEDLLKKNVQCSRCGSFVPKSGLINTPKGDVCTNCKRVM